MRLILSLSFRNLFRQKRRTLLLGAAIAFGMMILVIANSFALGISDNLFNRVIVFMTGHMDLSMMEKSKQYNMIIRDKDRFISLINNSVPNIKWIKENIFIMTRVFGNGKGEISVIVGADEKNKEILDYFRQFLVEGNLDDFENDTIENPVILYDAKAKALAVKTGDIVKVRLKTTTGQVQSARLTVAAVIRSTNMFQAFAMFVKLQKAKQLLNMKPYETGSLQVIFKKINNEDFAIEQADKIHKQLEPGIALAYGTAAGKKKSEHATMLGFYNSDDELALLKKNISIKSGTLPDSKSEKKAMVSLSLARNLNLKTGSAFTYSYKRKFEKDDFGNTYTVSGVFDSDKINGKNVVLLNEEEFYKTYLENLPAPVDKSSGAYIPEKSDILYSAFSPEWKLMPRTPDFDSLQTKIFNMQRTRWKGRWLDVRTMYESASQIIKLENALRLITFVAVIILFFIILIGVVNSLRMTIRERTREIGTVRSIGMQKSDVRNLFIAETLFLTLFASIIGIILGIILMKLAALITINTSSVFSMLLVDRHLYFTPDIFSIIGNIILILLIAGITAFFPAQRAAKLSAAVALRHYE